MAKFERIPGVNVERAFQEALKQNGIETKKKKSKNKLSKIKIILLNLFFIA